MVLVFFNEGGGSNWHLIRKPKQTYRWHGCLSTETHHVQINNILIGFFSGLFCGWPTHEPCVGVWSHCNKLSHLSRLLGCHQETISHLFPIQFLDEVLLNVFLHWSIRTRANQSLKSVCEEKGRIVEDTQTNTFDVAASKSRVLFESEQIDVGEKVRSCAENPVSRMLDFLDHSLSTFDQEQPEISLGMTEEQEPVKCNNQSSVGLSKERHSRSLPCQKEDAIAAFPICCHSGVSAEQFEKVLRETRHINHEYLHPLDADRKGTCVPGDELVWSSRGRWPCSPFMARQTLRVLTKT